MDVSAHSTDVGLAISAAQAGAEIIRARYGAPVVKTFKSERDFATGVDLEAERAIQQAIARDRPDDAFEGEEVGLVGTSAARRAWLVDPLCGTLNFAAGTPLVAVNVALRVDQQVVAAAMADPFSGETFWTDGEGAVRTRAGERSPLTPSGDTRLVDLDMDGDPVWAASLVAEPAFHAYFGSRVISSSLAVAWVAAGRRAAYVHAGDARGSVHFAAGIAVCRAAGCVVTDLRGAEVGTSGDGLLVAADAATHARLLTILSGLGAPTR
ncbi:phosphatase [Nocardioides psychrotolerans]|uniref:Myo-inositol-1(Or 4)-monophosphatase n=1 Tax=Nocardioides psychrotolerans TaxID=1005945 RepID=A0A1I3E0D2_9ACTN|nr:phosphatase [Nocardioides psychrotolerans]SFH92405.1 myo-inositol-1(or 4)-monophosphatase [Nocardioides psychrotolerans]